MESDLDGNITGGIFLIISNLAFVPSIILCVIYQEIPELAVFISMTIISSVYHFCQAGFVCMFSFIDLQVADHFVVYCTLIWVVLYFLGLTIEQRATFFLLFMPALLLCILEYMHSWYLSVAIIGGLVFVSVIVLVLITRRFPHITVPEMIAATIFIGGGLFFFVYSGDPGGTKYAIGHSIWHICIMLSTAFIIYIKNNEESWITTFLKKKFKSKSSTSKQKLKKNKDSSKEPLLPIRSPSVPSKTKRRIVDGERTHSILAKITQSMRNNELQKHNSRPIRHV